MDYEKFTVLNYENYRYIYIIFYLYIFLSIF